MSLVQVVSTVFETALVGFAIWAVFHEGMFIALENRIKAAVRRRRLRVVSSNTHTVR